MSLPRRNGIFDKLPGFYRIHGGDVLKRYVGIAEEGSAEFHASLARREAEVAQLVRVLQAGSGTDRANARDSISALTGTASAVTRWFERSGPGPEVWPGLEVSAESPTRLSFRATWDYSAVLAWTGEDRDEPPEDIALPDWLLPAGCRVESVWLRKPPKPCPPFPGLVLYGKKIPVFRRLSGATPERPRR